MSNTSFLEVELITGMGTEICRRMYSGLYGSYNAPQKRAYGSF